MTLQVVLQSYEAFYNVQVTRAMKNDTAAVKEGRQDLSRPGCSYVALDRPFVGRMYLDCASSFMVKGILNVDKALLSAGSQYSLSPLQDLDRLTGFYAKPQVPALSIQAVLMYSDKA